MKQTDRMVRNVWVCGGMALALAATDGVAQLGKTPAMGWNSWNNFACNVSQTLLENQANAMVSSGMAAAGYQYINVDDCWMGGRDANGNIQASSQFTNNSLATVAAYIHSKGLKFGTYTDVGNHTCASNGGPGLLGHEGQDIKQFVNWGVDYVKVDYCNSTTAQQQNPAAAYKIVGDSIAFYTKSHPLYFSICNWGQGNPWTWGRQDGGNQWRTTGDINASWGSVTGIIDQQVNLYTYSGPGTAGQEGGWNDPDMLEVGRGLTPDEDKSHFAIWCLLAAPLIAGNDLTNMSTATKAILTDTELIAVDQDSLGIQAQRISSANNLEVWARPLTGNARAVGLFNRSGATATITVNWSDLNKWSAYPWTTSQSVTVRDLYGHTDVATNQTGSYSASVPSHGIVVVKLSATPVPILPLAGPTNLSGIKLGSNFIRVNLPGYHSLQILDLTGRVLWSRSGNGASEYGLPGLSADGSRILRVVTPESRTDLRY